jgi:hypothetical protein
MPQKTQKAKLGPTASDPPFLPHTNKEMRETLAKKRFPRDKKAQRNFLTSSEKISLSPEELMWLIRVWRLQGMLARLDQIERRAHAIPRTDPSFQVAQAIQQKLARADGQLKKGNLTEFYAVYGEIEHLCGQANLHLLGPYAETEKRRRDAARRSRPRGDTLNQLIEKVLRKKPDLPALDVLKQLEEYDEKMILDDNINPDGDTISYFVSEKKTTPKVITRKTFLNRVSGIKKNLSRRPT